MCQNFLHFNLGQRMAQNFMAIAERFGKNESDSNYHSNGKIDISTFNQTQLVELLALPEGEEENFLALKAAEGTF